MLACYVFVCERAWLHVCVPVRAGLFLDVFVCLCVSPPLSVYALACVCVCLCVCIFGFVFDLIDSPRKRKLIHISTNVFSVSIMGHADPPRMFCHWGRRLDRFRSAEIDPGGGGTFNAKLASAKPLRKSNPHGGRGLLHGPIPQKTATMRRCACLSKASTQ